jgi:hypothetical protein
LAFISPNTSVNFKLSHYRRGFVLDSHKNAW